MKKFIALTVTITLLVISLAANAQVRRNYASAKDVSLDELINMESTLGQWYTQYKETTSNYQGFDGLLMLISKSEAISERREIAGLTHNQLHSPIVTLSGKDWGELDEMQQSELATIRIAMVELDIALSAIMATLPKTAHEEFIREVIRDAPPLTQVAATGQVSKDVKEAVKVPPSSIETMKALTLPDYIVTERVNTLNPSVKVPAPRDAELLVRPSNIAKDYYGDPLPSGEK
jgi:hypothetical protein